MWHAPQRRREGTALTIALTGHADKGQNARQDRGAGTSRATFSLHRLLRTTPGAHVSPSAGGRKASGAPFLNTDHRVVTEHDGSESPLPSLKRPVIGTVATPPNRQRAGWWASTSNIRNPGTPVSRAPMMHRSRQPRSHRERPTSAFRVSANPTEQRPRRIPRSPAGQSDAQERDAYRQHR